MRKDYYAVLGVSRAADAATIHSAFRALARRYHPDAGGESSSVKFREALEAYQALSDAACRRQHDLALGETISSPKVIAEPLFDPLRVSGGPVISSNSAFDQVLADIFRVFGSDF
ncbi:MAG: J domain-containing protein [Acidobacteria bacterium]|nr:J domain-containing protein [Acidobacteriota bacterium]MBV9624755.1 J domain-containing protein [Acidobacteriota bacterium]